MPVTRERLFTTYNAAEVCTVANVFPKTGLLKNNYMYIHFSVGDHIFVTSYWSTFKPLI